MSLLRVFTIPSKHVICKSGLAEFVFKASSRMAGSAAGEKDKKPLRKPKTPVGRLDSSEQETSKDVLERFPDDVNPVTKEKGGPKGPEPTRFEASLLHEVHKKIERSSMIAEGEQLFGSGEEKGHEEVQVGVMKSIPGDW